jgi:hypothetical protein
MMLRCVAPREVTNDRKAEPAEKLQVTALRLIAEQRTQSITFRGIISSLR